MQNNIGKAGGAGCVVARYQIGQLLDYAYASGGEISYYNDKTIHTFRSPGMFECPGDFNKTVEYVIIGGGGGGRYGSGGGAGGYLTSTSTIAGPADILVEIGQGGTGT